MVHPALIGLTVGRKIRYSRSREPVAHTRGPPGRLRAWRRRHRLPSDAGSALLEHDRRESTRFRRAVLVGRVAVAVVALGAWQLASGRLVDVRDLPVALW